MRSVGIPSQSIQFVDRLRVLAALAVVVAHTAGGMADGLVPLSGPWWGCIGLYYFVGFWAIPVFVMISGALLLDGERQESARDFYRRRLRRLAVPICFWTAFYWGLRVWRNPEALDAQQIVTSILQGRPYAHLWYLYMIPGLYLVTPFLRRLIRKTTSGQRVVVIVLMMVVADVYHLVNVRCWGVPSSIFFMFLPFVSYYLLGYELYLRRPKVKVGILVGTALVALAYLGLLARPFMALRGQQYNTFFFSFFGPPVALIAVLAFALAARYSSTQADRRWLDRFFARAAPLTLGIYVIHVALLEALRDMASHGSKQGNMALGLVAGPILAFTLSAAITALLLKIPYLRRTVS